MALNDYETLCISKVDSSIYSDEDLFKTACESISLLLKCGYVCTVRLEEADTVVINYNYDSDYGNAKPYWLTEDDYINLINLHNHNDEEIINDEE